MKYSKLNLANKLKQSPVEARHMDDREYNNDSALPSHGMLQNFSLLFRRGGRYCDQSLSLSELFAADSLSLGVVLLQPELLQDLQAQQGPLC